jgi:hypothetical protein
MRGCTANSSRSSRVNRDRVFSHLLPAHSVLGVQRFRFRPSPSAFDLRLSSIKYSTFLRFNLQPCLSPSAITNGIRAKCARPKQTRF